MLQGDAWNVRCCGPEGCGYINGHSLMRDETGEIVGRVPTRYCIGAKCAGWRWDDVPNPEYVKQSQSGMSMWPGFCEPMTLKSRTDGHCGLAGRP